MTPQRTRFALLAVWSLTVLAAALAGRLEVIKWSIPTVLGLNVLVAVWESALHRRGRSPQNDSACGSQTDA